MYLLPTTRRLGRLGLTQAQINFNTLYRLYGGKVTPFVNTPPAASTAPVITSPIASAGGLPTPRIPSGPIFRGPMPGPMPSAPRPIPDRPLPTNAGTPVPAGFPTNQIYVASDGSFWEYGPNGWVNVGTPYNTGAAATPAAPPPSSSGASTALPASTTAPAPVNVSVSPTSSSYSDVLNWLETDSLLATLGFAGIPNWITGGGVALLIYKVSSGARHRNPARRHRARRRR